MIKKLSRHMIRYSVLTIAEINKMFSLVLKEINSERNSTYNVKGDLTYENSDKSHSYAVKMVNVVGKTSVIDGIVREVLVRFHVVNVTIQNVLTTGIHAIRNTKPQFHEINSAHALTRQQRTHYVRLAAPQASH